MVGFNTIPTNSLFIAKLVLGKTGKVIPIDKQFYYSTRTDTLYSRDSIKGKWVVECDGYHIKGVNCPACNPDKFITKTIGKINGTKLPKKALKPIGDE